MKPYFLTALVVTAFVCGGCGTIRPDHAKSGEHNNPAEIVAFSPLSSDDCQEIAEQVVRHYAMTSTAARLGGTVTIFLALGQESAEPGNDLQSRLNTMVDIQVVPASRVEIVSDRWVDKQTGETGTYLKIGNIHQEAQDEVSVELIRFSPARADAPVSLIRLKRTECRLGNHLKTANKSCHPTPVDRVVKCCCPWPGVGALFHSARRML